MSVPDFAYAKLKQNNIPLISSFVECKGKESVGNLTFVINGVDYNLEPEDWLGIRNNHLA